MSKKELSEDRDEDKTHAVLKFDNLKQSAKHICIILTPIGLIIVSE